MAQSFHMCSKVGESLVSFYCEHDVIWKLQIFSQWNREVSDIIHPNSDEREWHLRVVVLLLSNQGKGSALNKKLELFVVTSSHYRSWVCIVFLSSATFPSVPRPSHMCEKEGLVFWVTFLVTWGRVATWSESSNQILECIIICAWRKWSYLLVHNHWIVRSWVCTTYSELFSATFPSLITRPLARARKRVWCDRRAWIRF